MSEEYPTLEDCYRAIANDPGNGSYYRERGTLYGQLGQAHHVLADFNTAIQLDSNDVEAWSRVTSPWTPFDREAVLGYVPPEESKRARKYEQAAAARAELAGREDWVEAVGTGWGWPI